LRSGALVSMEALVRWAHPERGMVPPGEFIPLAEETGAIVEIGRWVLRAACRQAQEWHERYPVTPPRRIAVNLSGLHLQQPSVVEDVTAALEESGLDPHCLTVEITESSMMQDTAATIAKLRAFKALGVSLAIDDFGTGYSSLSYLQQFPIDLLKIDRAFVSGVGQGVVDSALARAVVSLGSALGVQTVAEGIEEEEQVRELRELGCERGQGFYFSRPQDEAAITALLEQAQRGDWTGAPDQTEAA
jgi:EAL domain-containing protein (putative c-di-GMP-specific phosphodiesterase class I)